ncbi:Sodium/hydrogen exchanger family-domain-containing protein [Coprinopsis sp. MPI-PUGE-AT-0042]|nr:Sodium/hydrogen exchanger family-domain-containing protein [Coprinopsis sp. MPI-PUGE-AT-0042]
MAGFHPFEVTPVHIIYACLGGFIVLFGMFSLFLRSKLYISEACWAFLFGVIIGPFCADIFNPRAWSGGDEVATNVIVLEFTRVVLAIGVFAIGVELPKAYMARHWKSLFYLLVPVMTWGWLVSAAFIYALIPGLNYASSLAIAACLTPTDPILAAAVIGGKWADKHVPAHIRHLLAAESGCNDGAAFPFLFLALYILLDVNPRLVVKDWFLLLWFYQIFLSIIVGALMGFSFRHLMKFCERRDLIDRHSYVAQYVSLAIFTIGVCTLLGTDDLLAAFACGTAFAWDGFFNRQTEESLFSSVIDLLFNVAAFIFVGAWMPFNHFQDAALRLDVWRLIVIAILVLMFRRLPVMIALYKWIPDVKNIREAIFTGHFGPMGIGAIFISTFALEVIHKAHREPGSPNYEQIERVVEVIHPIVGFMVLCSITAHGLSIPSFSLGRRVHSVSRTWSRHATAASAGGVPEWANNLKVVKPGDEIIINRDRDVEAARSDSEKTREGSGESIGKEEVSVPTPTEVRFAQSPKVQTPEDQQLRLGSPVVRTPEQVSTPQQRASGSHLEELPLAYVRSDDSNLGRDWREPEVPDGGHVGDGEEVSEWIEGHQRVVETRKGPGEDVEVEVFDDPSQPHRRDELFQNAHDLGSRVKDALTPTSSRSPARGDRLSPTQEHPHHRHASRPGMKKRRSSGGSRTEARSPRTIQILDPPASPRNESAVDEEWESENEDSPPLPLPIAESSSAQAAKDKSLSRSPSKGKKSGGSKVGHSIRQFVAGKSARRGSHSGGAVPTVTVTPVSSVDAEQGRGRSALVPPRLDRPGSGGSGGSSFVRDRHLDRLMSGERSRGTSPARSIRFVDHSSGISGTRTPPG